MNEVIKKIGKRVLYYMPKHIAHSVIYVRNHNGVLKLFHPKTYDEKIHWHMINTYDKKYSKYADKYEVREYIQKCGYGDLLIPLVGGPYNCIQEIDFENLPQQFIIKTTHASGPNHYYICKNKANVDKIEIEKKFELALNENYAKSLFEYHYSSIKPRIICEELLQDSGNRMTDYKVVCSYGNPFAILVCSNRDEGRDYFSTEWEYLDYVKEDYKSARDIPKPSCLEKMIEVASALSKMFPLCRIDFYNVDGKLYFGEITLTPSAGNHNYLNDYGQIELGKQIAYPK